MKITVNVDCTPEEARAFLGLPDVRPMQEELLREMQARLAASIRAMEPEELMKTWLPLTAKGFEQMQDMFRQAMGAGRK